MSTITVALDAGHGIDSYPKNGSNGVKEMAEFEFNAAVVESAQALLNRHGFSIVLTQPLDGDSRPLSQRTEKARKHHADMVLSFHADANANSGVRGHWCFYWRDSEKGHRLADLWVRHARSLLPNPNRGKVAGYQGHWANFHMTRVPASWGVPALLMEHGFMTNPEDLKLLLSQEFRLLCAEVATRTVCEYFDVAYIPVQDDHGNSNSSHVDLTFWQRQAGEKALKELHDKGLITDRKQWMTQLDKPVPSWLFWEMLRRITSRQECL